MNINIKIVIGLFLASISLALADYNLDDMDVLREQFVVPFVMNEQELEFKEAFEETYTSEVNVQGRDPKKIVWSNFLCHLAKMRAKSAFKNFKEWDFYGHKDQYDRYPWWYSDQLEYDGSPMAENLAEVVSGRSAMRAWLNSPKGHRYYVLGITCYQGVCTGSESTFIGFGHYEEIACFLTSRPSRRYPEPVGIGKAPSNIPIQELEYVTQVNDFVLASPYIVFRVRNLEPGNYVLESSISPKTVMKWEEFATFTVETKWREKEWAYLPDRKRERQIFMRVRRL